MKRRGFGISASLLTIGLVGCNPDPAVTAAATAAGIRKEPAFIEPKALLKQLSWYTVDFDKRKIFDLNGNPIDPSRLVDAHDFDGILSAYREDIGNEQIWVFAPRNANELRFTINGQRFDAGMISRANGEPSIHVLPCLGERGKHSFAVEIVSNLTPSREVSRASLGLRGSVAQSYVSIYKRKGGKEDRVTNVVYSGLQAKENVWRRIRLYPEAQDIPGYTESGGDGDHAQTNTVGDPNVYHTAALWERTYGVIGANSICFGKTASGVPPMPLQDSIELVSVGLHHRDHRSDFYNSKGEPTNMSRYDLGLMGMDYDAGKPELADVLITVRVPLALGGLRWDVDDVGDTMHSATVPDRERRGLLATVSVCVPKESKKLTLVLKKPLQQNIEVQQVKGLEVVPQKKTYRNEMFSSEVSFDWTQPRDGASKNELDYVTARGTTDTLSVYPTRDRKRLTGTIRSEFPIEINQPRLKTWGYQVLHRLEVPLYPLFK
jgi:hypothetical protein